MEEKQLALLRRKLDALSYKETLDPVSGPLVQRILEDLVHTTESYRTLKLQHARQAQDISAFTTKLEVLKQDSGRIIAENSELHVKLIQHAELHDKREKDHYKHIKQLEDREAELSYWKHQAIHRFQKVEQENNDLKKRLQELLRLAEKRTQGDYPARDDSMKLLLSKPIGPPASPSPAPGASVISIDLVRASDARITSLQAQLVGKEQQLNESLQQLQELQDQVKRRDAEVGRLGKRVAEGPDMDRLGMEYRMEANENIILALNQQVDYLTAQLADTEEQVRNMKQVEVQLKEAQAAKTETDKKLSAAVKENQSIHDELTRLKKQVSQMRQKLNGAGLDGSPKKGNNNADVRKQLNDAKAEKDSLQDKLKAAHSSKEHAATEAAALKEQLETLQFLVDEARADADTAKQQVSDAQSAAEQSKQKERQAQEELQHVQLQLARVKQEVELKEALLGKLQQEKEATAARLANMERAKSSSKNHLSSGQARVQELEEQVSQLESELHSVSSSLASSEAELIGLRRQLKDTTEARLQATGRASSREGEVEHLTKELQALSAQLQQERVVVQQLTQARSDLEADTGKLKAEVGMLTAERQALQAAAEASDRTARERASQLHLSTKELGQVPSLQAHVEMLQQQARTTAMRLASAEGTAERLRAEAAQVSETAARAEEDVAELRRLLDEVDADRAVLRAQKQEAESVAAAANSRVQFLEVERDRAVAEQRTLSEEVARLRQVLDHEATSGRGSESALRGAQSTVASLQKQSALKNEELDRLQGMLKDAQQQADAAQRREEEARAQCHEYAERARRAETLAEEMETDVATLKEQQAEQSRALRTQDVQTAQLQRELNQRIQEVEQLTTLSLRGDATVQEYMSNLRVMASDLRASQLRCGDLEAQLAAQEETLQAVQLELHDARQVVRNLDEDRDQLQAELDSRAEREAGLLQELDEAHRHHDEVRRLQAAAEGRLQHTATRLKETEDELAAARQEAAQVVQALHQLQQQHSAMQEEYRAVSDDLEALVKENQVVGNELVTATRRLDSTMTELHGAKAAGARAEQAARAREMEVEDLRRAYSSLGEEQRRAHATVLALERDAAAREAALQAAMDEIASLQEAQKEAQAQAHQMAIDLAAYERQADALARQLNRGEGETMELGRAREDLLQELRVAQQVRFGLERAKEEVQRQLVATEGQVAGLQGRLQDSMAEARSLHARWQQERAHVQELEGLLATIRTQEFRQGLSSPQPHGSPHAQQAMAMEARAAELQDRLVKAEAEVLDLKAKVASLEQERGLLAAQLRDSQGQVTALKSALASAETAGGDSADLAGELAAREGVAQKQRVEAERKLRAVTQQLDDAQQGASRQEEATAKLRAELAAAREDQGRLLDLLAATDCEKLQLQRDNSQLHSKLAALRGSLSQQQQQQQRASGTNNTSSAAAWPTPSSATPSTQQSSTSGSSTLQERVEELEREKAALQNNLARASDVMNALHTELSRAEQEYGFASSSLQMLNSDMDVPGSSVGTPYTTQSATSFLTQS